MQTTIFQTEPVDLMAGTMRALTWYEPFASLMLRGKIETRRWPTKYRGPVLICAAKYQYKGAELLELCGTRQLYRMPYLGEPYGMRQTLGHAIAVGNLIDCRPMTPEDEDATFVKFAPGLFCHIYQDVKAIDPLPWKGYQGWRTVPDEFKQLIKFKMQEHDPL
jgi:hypothetical protein